jgi:hypothetical protein
MFTKTKLGKKEKVTLAAMRKVLNNEVRNGEWFGMVNEKELVQQLFTDIMDGEHYIADGYLYEYVA